MVVIILSWNVQPAFHWSWLIRFVVIRWLLSFFRYLFLVFEAYKRTFFLKCRFRTLKLAWLWRYIFHHQPAQDVHSALGVKSSRKMFSLFHTSSPPQRYDRGPRHLGVNRWCFGRAPPVAWRHGEWWMVIGVGIIDVLFPLVGWWIEGFVYPFNNR